MLIDTDIPVSLVSKMNCNSSFSICDSMLLGPLCKEFATGFPFRSNAAFFVHSLYCFGCILTFLHDARIDSPFAILLRTTLSRDCFSAQVYACRWRLGDFFGEGTMMIVHSLCFCVADLWGKVGSIEEEFDDVDTESCLILPAETRKSCVFLAPTESFNVHSYGIGLRNLR
jgi:hypothetical protein